MKLRARLLCWLHRLSMGLMLAAVLMGYQARATVTAVGNHSWAGFLFSLVIGFAYAMTIFYFAGLGVGMSQAAAGRNELATFLHQASSLRKRLAWPLGLALVMLMAAVILGGGSQTQRLPFWPHQVFSLAALIATMYASWKSQSLIRTYEGIISRVEAALEDPGSRIGQTAQRS